MAETRIIVDKMKLRYEGLFNMSEMYNLVDSWLEENNYDKFEKANSEQVTPDGKHIWWQFFPWKKITDYAKQIIKIECAMSNVKEVEIERDGVKVRLNQGEVEFAFTGYLETDYENRWEAKPTYYFLRAIFDKFIYKIYTDKFTGSLVDDVNTLSRLTKSYLNMHKYR